MRLAQPEICSSFSYYSVLCTRQKEFHIRKAYFSPSSLINIIGHSALIDTGKAINSYYFVRFLA